MFTCHTTLDGIKPEIIAIVTGYIIESVKSPDPSEREILKRGYQQGTEDLKNKIRRYLISQGILDEYFLADVCTVSIQSRDIQLLQSLIQNPEITDRDVQQLKNILKSVSFEQPQILSFIELMLASGFDKEANGKGNKIYQGIIDSYVLNHFNTRKLNQLQDRYGRIQIPAPRPARINLKTAIIIILVILAILGLVVIMLSYFGMVNIIPAGNQSSINQTTNGVTTIQQAVSNAPGGLLNGSNSVSARNQTNGSS
jgi:hypothetical protein